MAALAVQGAAPSMDTAVRAARAESAGSDIAGGGRWAAADCGAERRGEAGRRERSTGEWGNEWAARSE